MSETKKEAYWFFPIVNVILWTLVGIEIGIFFIAPMLSEPVSAEAFSYGEKETSMVEKVRVISSQWDGCWLSIGEENNALYWKCDRFASRIGKWFCSEEEPASPEPLFAGSVGTGKTEPLFVETEWNKTAYVRFDVNGRLSYKFVNNPAVDTNWFCLKRGEAE